MKTSNRIKGLALAATAASLFAMAPAPASAGESTEGKCMGVNACKGHSDCKTAKNECAGHNACKGQGFVMMDEKTCEQLGGDFVMTGFLKRGQSS
jgi:hypothetical protein